MSDLPLALLVAVALTFLLVELTASMARDHLGVVLPKPLRYGSIQRNVGRRALIVEIPFTVALLGGGEVIVLAMLFDPTSSLIVRLVAALQLVSVIAWAWYLLRLIDARNGDPPKET